MRVRVTDKVCRTQGALYSKAGFSCKGVRSFQSRSPCNRFENLPVCVIEVVLAIHCLARLTSPLSIAISGSGDLKSKSHPKCWIPAIFLPSITAKSKPSFYPKGMTLSETKLFLRWPLFDDVT
jgi:hypothetical protein